jgi:hypothetical protein
VAELPPPASVTGVAAARESEETIGETWISWLQADTLTAAIHSEGTMAARSETGPLGLRQASLQRVGWRLTPDTASFAVLGLDSNNRPSLALITFSRSAPPTIKRFAVGSGEIPALWRVGHRDGSPVPQWILVFDERTSASSKVRCQGISVGGSELTPAVTLFEHSGPTSTLGFSPVNADSNVVDILLGPFVETKSVRLVRVAAPASDAPIGQWEIPLPKSTEGGVLSNLTISDYFLQDPVVLAKNGAQLLARRASAGDWGQLADQSASAQHFQLILLDNHPWATWSDRAIGLRLQFVR